MKLVVAARMCRAGHVALMLAGVVAAASCVRVKQSAVDGGGAAGGGGAADDSGVIFVRYDGPPAIEVAPTDSAPGRVVGSAPLGDAACAAQTQKAEKLPLDMYVMLDSSSSMTELTMSGQSKWDAIRMALTQFLRDPNSAGLGVGLQYFPLTTAGVPPECAVDADCGTHGPCHILKTCAAGANVTVCETNADCGRGDTCVPLGGCSASDQFCIPVGTLCGGGRGVPRGNTCLSIPGYCTGRDLCGGASYAAPAVEVAALPGSANGLVASLMQHAPDGLTPTSGALTGAITHAQALAKASNDGHRVVVLLATDGLPSECTPFDTPGVASIAASGLAATPSISTFVIGVFAPDEQADAQTTLDAIAVAGGTKQSFVINLGQNVTQAFVADEGLRDVLS